MNENTMTIFEQDESGRMLQALRSPEAIAYCSFVANTTDEKIKLYNAMTNPEKRVSEMVNKKIPLKDVYVEIVQMTNKETGEVQPAPRIVLIDEKGTTYSCMSLGIFNSLKSLFNVFGTPDTWESPVIAEVLSIDRGERRVLSLRACV